MEASVHEPAASSGAVIGRDAEVHAAARALAAERLPALVVLDGEAGIGKTTVWAAVVASARESGLRVLAASPVEAEAKLAYAVLADLLGDVLETTLPRLPPPQRRALEVALLLDDADGAAPEDRTLAAGLLSSLRLLAASDPTLLAVDDVQWCDAASAAVLAFALRRVAGDRVGLLAARRVAAVEPLPLGLDRPAVGARVERVAIGPLSLGALHQVVRRRLDLSLSRPMLRRVHEAVGGNPFFALEIARAVGRRSDVDPSGPLPVPTDLHDLVRGRLAELPAPTREVLAVAAALAGPTVEMIEAAAEGGTDVGAALDVAVAAGVLERAQGRVHFSHPLLAAAAYAAVGEEARPRLHARLAQVVEDPEERAHHLAVSTEEPDLAIATEVEAAGRAALGRGALAAAADLFAAARRLTPPARSEIARRLALAEAECWVEAGDNPRARRLLQGLHKDLPVGGERAAVLIRLGHACLWGFDWRASIPYLEQALDEAGDDLARRLEAQRGLMLAAVLICDDVAEMAAHGRRTAQLAEEAGHEAFLASALALQARAEVMMGRPFPHALAARAMALEPRLEHVMPMERPSDYLAAVDGWMDRIPQAIDTLERISRAGIERGEDTASAWTVGRISQLRCLTGEWEVARERALEAYEFTLQAGQPANQATMAATLALVDAHRGAEADARAWAAEALEVAEAGGAVPARRVALAALGLLELSLERAQAARDALDPLVAEVRGAGFAEPGAMRFVPDAVEARLAAGDMDAAASLLDWYDDLARRVSRTSALAAARRCRGLMAVAGGETGAAVALLHEALVLHGDAPLPLERARTLLALGTAQRRAKRRREARATLQAAGAELERLGAAAWLRRAAAELASIGGRPSTDGELTPTERRVAELVAGGASNREVAAVLFLSPKTVEFHLRNVFRKLGISSRGQLGPWLASER